MEFRILGPLEAREDGVPVALGGTKQRALLAVLLLHANEVVSTDALVDSLWDEPPARAAKAVQVYASRLRKALGGTMPTSRSPGYVLEVDPERLDLARFRRLLTEARRDADRSADLLDEALALWRGPALAEFTREPFAAVERLRLEELRIEAVEEWIDAELQRGRHAALAGELEALVAAHPLRERLRGQLMLALYRCGRQADALASYRVGRQLLVEELGIEPGRGLQELEQAILRQDPALDVGRATAAPAKEAPEAPRVTILAGLAEERKVVSVLFVDVVRFATPADPADPEDIRAALGPFHAAATREIERRGGTLERTIGDALVAVFGAPVAHEDDPDRAVRTALAIRSWIEEEGGDLEVGMGVHTGVALVSRDSSRQHGSIAAGEVAAAAQRLQLAAPAKTIVVGESTYRASREDIEYREVEGEPGKPRAWLALQARFPLGFAVPPASRSPFVGRQRELELLASALARVRDERAPQLVTLVGVPGIGKSRLVSELFESLDRAGAPVTWRSGRCLPYGDGVSFWALGEIVKAQAGILESDTPEQAEEKLGRTVAAAVSDAQDAPWVERHLRPLVGASGELPWEEHSGDAFPAWRRFLEGVAEARPLVLVVEDLHWADQGLLQFVDELADRIRDTPLLVLCTARPELLERQQAWGGGKANALTITLPPLSDGDTEQIAAAVLEQSGLAAAAHDELVARAEGNPLYAEQLARVLAERGRLDALPETVHGIIAARLDGLAPPEKALLQDAAVVGKVFWLGALGAVGGASRHGTDELLFRLERKEFIQRARGSSVEGQADYAFKHVLLRDVAYEQIPRADRAGKHRSAAAWIESLGRPDDHAEMLAHHYLSAITYTKAAGRLEPALVARARSAVRAAGDRALALASYAAAARFYDAALELSPVDDPDRAWLLVHAGRANHAADRSGIDLFLQGLEELRRRGDIDGAAEVAVEVGRCFWLSGDRDAAYAYTDQALELAQGRAKSKARAHALVARAALHMIASENSEAMRLAREALPLTEALGLDHQRARTLDVLGHSRVFLGDPGGLDDEARAIELARASNAFSQLIVAENNLCIALFLLGQRARASAALREFGPDFERYDTAALELKTLTGVHEAYLDGRWHEAAGVLDGLLVESEHGVARYGDPGWRVLSGLIQLARGSFETAAAHSEQALERARKAKDLQVLLPALVFRSMVLVARGQRDAATRLVDEIVAHAPVLVIALFGWVPTVTPVEFAWLLRDLGREDELGAALASAPSIPWVEGAAAIAAGEFTRGIDVLEEIGAPAIEAYTRLRAGEALADGGRGEEARAAVAPALAFFEEAGATHYAARAAELLAS